MFFEKIEQIREIASKVGAGVFVVPESVSVEIPGAIVIQPEEKTIISIEQIHSLVKRTKLKQTTELFVILRPADKLGGDASNAFLKCLEEPGENVHFVLITEMPSKLFPTILSRCAIYYYRQNESDSLSVDERVKEVAKHLMVAKPADLPIIAEKISKKKEGARAYALKVVGAAIEMLYKSYYITGKEAFLARLPRFLTLYDNLEKNGHIKLHIVADLI